MPLKFVGIYRYTFGVSGYLLFFFRVGEICLLLLGMDDIMKTMMSLEVKFVFFLCYVRNSFRNDPVARIHGLFGSNTLNVT
jgi:hypothetical protein